MLRKMKGFTLIELLIVVAIIAILAAIAVPNFLEAQVRSKVARQLTNMRTAATAMEAYFVDDNAYPITTGISTSPFQPPTGTWVLAEWWKFYPGYPSLGKAGGLTTPIAYVSSVDAIEDIFRLPHRFSRKLANQIMYLPSFYYKPPYFPADVGYGAQARAYGEWVLRSAGPDTWYQNQNGLKGDYDDGGWGRQSYDATNGTVSEGDIYRSQKRTTQTHSGASGGTGP
ncbi:MAG: prepilin-type N-terminal cleavage/methylation domain-containing protein [bacterium]